MRDKKLEIVTVDEDIKNEKGHDSSLSKEEFRELFERYYELEINRLDKEYEGLTNTIH